MTEPTLYLIQSDFANTGQAFKQLDQIYSPNDVIVLMGDSVLHAESELLKNKNPIFVLENDAEIMSNSISEKIQIIDYAQFSEVILSFKRCISLK